MTLDHARFGIYPLFGRAIQLDPDGSNLRPSKAVFDHRKHVALALLHRDAGQVGVLTGFEEYKDWAEQDAEIGAQSQPSGKAVAMLGHRWTRYGACCSA